MKFSDYFSAEYDMLTMSMTNEGVYCMSEVFDIRKFDEYKEDNRREVKKAKQSIPVSLWDTYSSFANCYGGVIILGVKEREDGSWYTTGLQDPARQKKIFWDTINNRTKVSINLLTEKDVETYEMNGDTIMVVHVPMAKREQKPVYINDDLFGGTFRRNWEGDYHCTPLQVKAMLRDQTEDTYDMNVLPKTSMSDLNYDTIHSYRNRHQLLRPGHPFEGYSDDEYLRSIGAASISDDDGQLHPTGAGLLMFGDEFNIIRQFPEYFLDYREILDPTIRWTDRLQSSSGEWSGNLCDFYFRVYNKIQKDIKVPFDTKGGDRIDDTPVHKALREALANCLINADFFGKFGVVIKKEADSVTLENPGYIRVGKKQMLLGGLSDPRNKALMKMFNMINVGERAGSGVPNILQTWSKEQWIAPEIEEQFNPDRTILKLSFLKKTDLGGGEPTQAPTQASTQATQAPTQVSDGNEGPHIRETVYTLSGLDLAIVNLMRKQPGISQNTMADELKVNRNTLKYHVARLKSMQVIERKGSSQKGAWIVKI
ncbi:MAG: putative DNA binding domain-containing protein [Eubacterium sp.]|nr:putative DNA binding domain-containing protein [Eubacterium sp.]